MSITGFDQLAPDAWDAFSGFPFSRSLLSILDPCSGFCDTAGFSMASMDWKETPEAHVLKVDLPGMKKEEVKVEVEGNLLRISGERAGEQAEKDDGTSWHLIERSSGKFMRSLRLPENARMDDVKAAMENGVLTVTVPKAEDDVKTPKLKPVEIECVKKDHPSCLKLPRLFRSKKPDQADQKTSH